MSFDDKRNDMLHSKILEIQELAVKRNKWRTCLNCDSFVIVTKIENDRSSTYQQCKLYKAVPPPEIIVHGCRDHYNDDIPF